MGGSGRVHALVEAALLAGITIALVLATRYLPLVGYLLGFALPLPIVATYTRHGPRLALQVVLVAGLVTGLLLGPVAAVFTAVDLAALGFSLGWGIRGRREPGVTIAVGAAAVAGLVLFSYGVSLLFFRENLLTEMVSAFVAAGGESLNLYARMGIPAAEIKMMRATFGAVGKDVLQLWPSIVTLASIMGSAIPYAIGSAVLRRADVDVKPLPPFATWRLPWPAVGAWVAGEAILLLIPHSGLWRTVGANLQWTFSLLFVVSGLALLYTVLRHFRSPRALSVAVCIAAVINALLVTLIMWAGMFDALFDYRRLLRARA